MSDRERWQELAELAAAEQDPEKLMTLVREITLLLDQKQSLQNQQASASSLKKTA
jgi:hypothetical protein